MDKLINNRITIFLSILLVIYATSMLSLGQSARWDLLDHVSMADNFVKNGHLYPSKYDKFLTGASVYFPGLSLLSILLKYIINDNYIIGVLHIFSFIAILLFFIIQLYITESLGLKINRLHFFFITIIFYFLFEYKWLVYAIEFKPDVLAFDIGSLGIIIGILENKENNFYRFFLGTILFGIAIIFKQQYVAFQVGLIFYSLYKKNGNLIRFSFISTLITIVILFFISSNVNTLYWTITVLKDDGFLSFKQWLNDHIIVIVLHLCLLFFLFLKSIQKKIPHFSLDKLVNIWTFPLISISLISFFSSFKIGGNSGNTCFGIVVLLPFIYLFLSKVEMKFTFLVFVIIVSFQTLNFSQKGIKKYLLINDLNFYIANNIKSYNSKILTGSDLYGVARKVKNTDFITNYWMYGVRDNTKLTDEFKKISELYNFDLLIVENWDENLLQIKNSKKYKILFKNELGIIAKLNKN